MYFRPNDYALSLIHISYPGARYDRGLDISPTFDGWEANSDGTFSMYFGYYNRNAEEEVDIPLGPENSFDVGGSDQGQPTHFYPGRRWFVFKVVVPKDWPGEIAAGKWMVFGFDGFSIEVRARFNSIRP